MKITRERLRPVRDSQGDAVHFLVVVVERLSTGDRRENFHALFEKRLYASVENGEKSVRFLGEGVVVIIGIGTRAMLFDYTETFLTLKRRAQALLAVLQPEAVIGDICKAERSVKRRAKAVHYFAIRNQPVLLLR